MKCGWRSLKRANESLLSRLKGKVLFLSEESPPYPWRRLSPFAYRKVLGTEWDHLVIDLRYPVPANAFPATMETVKAGGTIAYILEKDLSEVYGKEGTGLFGKYLKEALDLYEEKGPCPPWRPPTDLTKEQKMAMKKLGKLIVSNLKVLAIIGDRGRGKSALLGAMASSLVSEYEVKRVEVTSISPEMPSFLKMFKRMMEKRRMRFRIEKAKDEWRILGPGWRVEWVPPARAGRGGVTMIDEAAAIGVSTVRRIINRSWRTILATTVHGYEGSGRALTKMLLNSIKDKEVVELKEPVRYAKGDPVETWLYKAFHLDAEPKAYEPSGEPREVNREEVASPKAMRPYASLLAFAHYRWEPSDIQLVLEHPKGKLWEYPGDGGPVAVAFTVDEEPPDDPWEVTKGAALSRLLSRIRPTKARRVVRIAVTPELQRKGYGSRLLSALEWEVTGAIFSNHEVLDFWIKNGYKVIYVSPRFNKYTGEKNVAVAKGGEIVEIASRLFTKRFLLSAHSVYRDIDPKKAVKMVSKDISIKLEVEEELLKLYLEGKIEKESAFPALYSCALRFPGELTPATFGFLIQGKTVWDLAASYETSPEEVEELLERDLRALALKCLEHKSSRPTPNASSTEEGLK